MHRATKIAITLAAICGAVACMSTSALASPPKGRLTSAEYKQLSTATAALNKSASAKSINWTKARAACRATGGATALLATQRTSCLDSVSTLEALAKFPSEQAKCASAASTTTDTTTTSTTTATGTTPTGTTTAAESSVVQLLICLNPRYQALGRYAHAMYKADLSARSQAVARGFTGLCLATLASTAAELRSEKSFASSTAKLAGDVALLIKITKGQAPSSDLNQTRIGNDVTRFERAARIVLEEHGTQKLSACPHE